MFNFRNRKRFGEEDIAPVDPLPQEEPAVEERPAPEPAEEASAAAGEPQPAEETAPVEEPASQQAAEQPPAEEVTPEEPEKAEEPAEAPAPPEQDFAAIAAEQNDFSDFSLNEAFEGFNANDYPQEQPKEEETVINVEMMQQPPAEEAAEQTAATETVVEVEIAPADEAPAQEAQAEPADGAPQGEVPAQEEGAAEQAQPAEAQQQPAGFDPKDYMVDLNYKDKSVFEVDYAELPDEEKPQFVESTRNIIRMMALNTNNLINLVQRKNKRIAQYEEVAKLLESNQRDFENYKRRNADLAAKAQEEGFGKALVAVLPTLDNFERAIAMIPDPATAEGVVMIERQLRTALEKLGVKEIEALGKEFDPNFHNAVMQQETDDEEQADKVVEVFQKGYICGEKVLRYAQVKVAKKY